METLSKEVFSRILPEVHNATLLINSIGYNPFVLANQTITHHYEEGQEDITLHNLWEYCKANPHHDTKVIYLHSKGSFHDTKENSQLRDFVTEGALSEECASLPDQCHVYSSRMSPLPHPLTSGNMWLARCDYVARLNDPFAEVQYEQIKSEDIPCNGWGRYYFEHWIHSHPSVKPCDLYVGKEYVWNYGPLPSSGYEKHLEMAPRFEKFQDYAIGEENCSNQTQNASNALHHRLWEYNQLYKQRPDQSWWGWKFYDINGT